MGNVNFDDFVAGISRDALNFEGSPNSERDEVTMLKSLTARSRASTGRSSRLICVSTVDLDAYEL
jgi:hypothetical protein